MSTKLEITNEDVSLGVVFTIFALLVVMTINSYMESDPRMSAILDVVAPFLYIIQVVTNKNSVKKWLVSAPLATMIGSIVLYVISIAYKSIF